MRNKWISYINLAKKTFSSRFDYDEFFVYSLYFIDKLPDKGVEF